MHVLACDDVGEHLHQRFQVALQELERRPPRVQLVPPPPHQLAPDGTRRAADAAGVHFFVLGETVVGVREGASEHLHMWCVCVVVDR